VAVAALGAGTALTQQSAGLRGPLTHTEIERQLRADRLSGGRPESEELTTATTSPVSAPPRRTATPLFAGDGEEIFAEPIETGTVPTSTARERRRARQANLEDEAVASRRTGQDTEEDITTGTVRVQPIRDGTIDDFGRAPAESSRQAAIEGLGRAPDPNPYAPTGLRAGSFELFPSLEQGIGWTSNAGNTAGGGSSTFSETTLRLEAQSDWSRHSSRLSGAGTYRKSISGAPISEFEGNLDGQLRLDLSHDFDAILGIGYDVRPESAHAPGAIAAVASRPNRHVLTGTAGLAKDAGPVRLAATTRLTRTTFDDARLVDGTTASQRDRNSTLAAVTLRGGYAVSAALTPFVEGEIGRRFQDVRIDSDGFARSANRYAMRGGVELDLSEKLTGEVAAGWLVEKPDDPALASISGLSVEGNLNWSPLRGTNVTLFGTTSVEGSTTPGESGTLFYSSSLTLSRDLRSNLTASTTFGADYRRYPDSGDHDLNLRGEASLTWWLNRHAGIVGRVRHERFRSSRPDRDSRESSVYVGIRAQH
jgi:hypothetical protein